MLVKTFGSAVYGVDAVTITIEVNVLNGSNYFIVGLPDSAVKESLQRVESAIKSNGYAMPRTKAIVNLAPADIKKSGSAFDLPIALGMLAATGQLPRYEELESLIVMGELNLDGTIQPIRGALPMALTARKEGFRGLILPVQNAREAAIVSGPAVFGVSHLKQVMEYFREDNALSPVTVNARDDFAGAQENSDLDFADVKGQDNIKRAMEIAAAGGHNAILIGPPGSGKTMLARRITTILPPLSLHEALETTRIHSVAGKLQHHSTLVAHRPFRSPHHTLSHVALVGGGSIPQPGEISLAHNGVLFLDELPEFKRNVLEVLRQPVEERKVTISRARSSVEFPAGFMLLASMNPCPCGYYNHPERECTCAPGMVQKYLNRISGPLLDRIDLHVEVTPVPFPELLAVRQAETSAMIRERVMRAREMQQHRYQDDPAIHCNAMVGVKALKKFCAPDNAGSHLLQHAMQKLSLSARAFNRILKVARTISDLAHSENIKAEHIAEAIHYRSLDREGWAG